MYAVKENKLPLIDRLIDLGCDVTTRNKVCYILNLLNFFDTFFIRIILTYCILLPNTLVKML